MITQQLSGYSGTRLNSFSLPDSLIYVYHQCLWCWRGAGGISTKKLRSERARRSSDGLATLQENAFDTESQAWPQGGKKARDRQKTAPCPNLKFN